MQGDLFGASVGPWQVEQAVINLLQGVPPDGQAPLLVYYLADQERVLGLPPRTVPVPPGSSSYRGGVDDNTLEAEWFPVVHVVVEPSGAPVRLDWGGYAQSYEVRVTATCGDNDEDIARRASYAYGAAIAQAVIQNGTLGISATNTVLVRAPTGELLNAISNRQVVRTTVTFDTLIAPAFTTLGPASWNFAPYAIASDWPEIQDVSVTVTAVPDGQVP
jgi:hypothetical protein